MRKGTLYLRAWRVSCSGRRGWTSPGRSTTLLCFSGKWRTPGLTYIHCAHWASASISSKRTSTCTRPFRRCIISDWRPSTPARGWIGPQQRVWPSRACCMRGTGCACRARMWKGERSHTGMQSSTIKSKVTNSYRWRISSCQESSTNSPFATAVWAS